MRKQLCLAVTALALATVPLPARAQSFLTGSFETIQPGNLRMIGAPTHMFGRDGRPDRSGAAFRLGYGLTESLGLEGNAAFFDGVTLVGGDGHFRLLEGDTTLSLGERAFVSIEAGLGLNDDSPHYLAAAVAWRVPVSDSARGRERR